MSDNNSVPGPLRLIGEEWIAHGYQYTPGIPFAEECPICGSPNTTCTAYSHEAGMKFQREEQP